MICVPIARRDHREAMRMIEKSAPVADAIELRMDIIEGGDLERLMAAARQASSRVKIIVTCRRPEESLLPAADLSGGSPKEITAKQKLELFRQAVTLGADFIDMELALGEPVIRSMRTYCRRRKASTQIIVSWHDVSKTPTLRKLKEIFEACVQAGADLVKIVPFARRMEDNLTLLGLLAYAASRHQKMIAMCMGEQGQISRLIAPFWGSVLSFAVPPGGGRSAPGQLSVGIMREFQHLVEGRTCPVQPWLLPPGAPSFVLLGNPVAHSLSPLMHNKALAAMHIDGHYSAFCVTDLAAAVTGIRGMNIRGASVTIPFKTDVMAHLDEIDADAAALGAVNTIVNERGRLTGYNTDWLGLIRSLTEKTDIAGKKVAILGAGGTARAAVYGVKKEGGFPIIVNRSVGKAERLAAEFDCPCYPLLEIGTIEAHALVNTTSVGMFPRKNASPVPAGALKNFSVVMDVIYNPLQTKLLKDAEAQGCRAISGLEMFVRQGAAQLKLWTGKEAPLTLMHKTVRERLETLGSD